MKKRKIQGQGVTLQMPSAPIAENLPISQVRTCVFV